MNDRSMGEIEDAIGYVFDDAELVEIALTHSSYANEHAAGESNERLEFLGDAVVGMLVAELLFGLHPEWSEGELTRARAALVNRKALADRARDLDLGRFVRLGTTERQADGGTKNRVLADCFEAVLGAIYLDGGFGPALAFVRRCFGEALEGPPRRDAKSELQEWAMAELKVWPRYEMLVDSGVEGAEDRFTIGVSLDGERRGVGVGRSKQAAEQAAAGAALVDVGQRDVAADA